MKNMKKILKIIYESNKKKSNLSGKITMIWKKKNSIKPGELVTITNYLDDERYIKIDPYLDGLWSKHHLSWEEISKKMD